MENFISIKETAELLGVSTLTLRNWDSKGKLVSYRNPVNNYRMYKISQVEEFFEKMRTERFKRGKFKIKVKIIRQEE